MNVSGTNPQIVIERVQFSKGYVVGDGAAVNMNTGAGGKLLLRECLFSQNFCTGDGGAVCTGGRAGGAALFAGGRAGGRRGGAGQLAGESEEDHGFGGVCAHDISPGWERRPLLMAGSYHSHAYPQPHVGRCS